MRFSAVAQVNHAPLEESYIVVELMGVAEIEMEVMTDRDSLYLPYVRLFEFFQCNLTASPDFSTIGAELTGGASFTIDRVKFETTVNGVTSPYDPEAVQVIDGEIFIDRSLLQRCIGVSLQYSYDDMRLFVPDVDAIPRASLAHHRAQWSKLKGGEETTEIEDAVHFDRQLFGAATLDWSYQGSIDKDPLSMLSDHSGSIDASLPFLFGILSSGANAVYSGGTRNLHSVKSNGFMWDFYIPEFSPLSTISLSSLGTSNHTIRLSNAPLAPTMSLGTHDFRGQTQPGWTVEMYDERGLVGVTRADSTGQYRFPIPVGYGLTKRKTVTIGPNGERVEEIHEVQFNRRLLPAGTVDYQLTASAQSFKPTTPFYSIADVRVGVFTWLSVGTNATLSLANVQSLVTRGTRWYDSTKYQYLADVWLGGKSDLNLSFNQTERSAGATFSTELFKDIPLTLGLRDLRPLSPRPLSNVSATFGTAVPLWAARFTPSASYSDGDVTVRSGLSATVYGVSGYVDTDVLIPVSAKRPPPTSSEVNPDTAVATLGAPSFKNSRLMLAVTGFSDLFLTFDAVYDHQRKLIANLSANLRYSLTQDIGIDLGYSVANELWDRAVARLGLSFSAEAFMVSAGASAQEERYRAYWRSNGSVRVAGYGVDFSRNSLRGQSTILLHAFRDRNGTGEQEEGEEDLPTPEGLLLVGELPIESEDGRITNVPTNQEGTIEVDQWTLADDNLYPSKLHFGIYPMPNSVYVVDVPYREGFEVSGQCEVEFNNNGTITRSVRGINGLRIWLESTTGVGRYDGEIFSDGSILIIGVPPGSYRVRLDEKQLKFRRIMPAEPLPDNIVIESAAQALPEIILVPEPSDIPSPTPTETE